jgi:hypothetical protein
MTSSSFLSYPELFSKKLEGNLRIRSAIDSSFSPVADILKISKLPFFPDYTDHGIPHLSKVLEIADKLIADRARELFSAEDAAVLTFSVLSHDLALHLSEAGFQSLLKAPSWANLWREFLSTAKHWDDRKLVEIFGADEAGAPLALVRDPFGDYNNLTESDRKLIGEFIRQHHPQLAYEFAMVGFPGTDGRVIPFGSFSEDLRELAGIIARSHGFHLREGIRQLEQKQFSKLEHNNVHPVFLMGALRVADFLDLGDNRAPLIAFAYKEFKSPISRREWRTNQAFRTISWGNPDPESIHIPAKPTDVFSYLELKQWLAAIQFELDVTWAVFGEVYGAHPKFSCLGLSIRRVRSNITDDPKAFAKDVPYVPVRVELGAAGADVLKLFVEPLYGNRPEVGIRELIQNAVDAVRERWEFEKNHPQPADRAPSELEGDVVAWLDDPDQKGVAMLTVSDRGIGMTEEIIVNYFLKAGASFRRSVAWKKEFESEDGAAAAQGHPKSRVLRSGRFGIGVLAAFLLGDEIEVSTRHITSERGIRFSSRLDLRPAAFETAPIQLTYAADLPVGTTIKVRVTKDTSERSYNLLHQSDRWDWYCLRSPSVVRLLGSRRKRRKQFHMFPDETAPSLPVGWYRVATSDYRTVYAVPNPARCSHLPKLTVNGIVVKQLSYETEDLDTVSLDFWPDTFRLEPYFLGTPSFSIFDPDGNLPLDVRRTGLTHKQLDFMEGAFAVQAKALLATLLITVPREPTPTDEFRQAVEQMFRIVTLFPVFFTKLGAGILLQKNLQAANVRNCLLVNVRDISEISKGWLEQVSGRYDATIFSSGDLAYGVDVESFSSWVGSARMITRRGTGASLGKLKFKVEDEAINALSVFRTGDCPPSLLTRKDFESAEFRANPMTVTVAELFLRARRASKPEPECSVGHYWEEIIRQPLIPFDLAERRSKLSYAYEALSEYIADFASPSGSRKHHKT